MRKFKILIPASPTTAFFSQIAAFSLALRKIKWTHWEPSIRIVLGGASDILSLGEWYRYLPDVEIVITSQVEYARSDNWSQCDSVFDWLPIEAEVVLTMDADTLPVRNFEDVLDRVAETNVVAGVMAHFPPPDERPGDERDRDLWAWLSEEFIQQPLEHKYSYSLVESSVPAELRCAPFYVNFGVVFFPGSVFARFSQVYNDLRRRIANRLLVTDFSGQLALALTAAKIGVGVWDLPMRMNFPNDDLAARLSPDELSDVRIFHYLRTDKFNRHLIFTSSAAYESFLNTPMDGVNLMFQCCVRQILGDKFPFVEGAAAN